MDKPEIMTIEEVAAYLRVSDKTVYSWAKKGLIPAGKLGTSWRFLRSDIEDWVHSRLTSPRIAEPDGPIRVDTVLEPSRALVLDTASKEVAIRALVDALASAKEVRDREALSASIQRRESLLSTGLGLGVAVPHARLAEVDDVVMAVGVAPQGIADYETLDAHPIRIVFMVAAGTAQHAHYLRLMATLSGLIKDAAFRGALLASSEPMDLFRTMTQWPACTR